MIYPPENTTLSVVLSPDEILPEADVWMVVDVLRCTTTITTYFALGGKELFVVDTPEKARKLKKELGKDTLLLGERRGLPPEGFDLGNSPRDLTPQICREHPQAVMTTTNGTRAILKARETGKPVIAASLANASAVAQHCRGIPRKGILCAGASGRSASDDILAAGYLVDTFLRQEKAEFLDDGASVALWVWQANAPDMQKALEQTKHGRYLRSLGFQEDLPFCASPDRFSAVPQLSSLSSQEARPVFRGEP